MAGYAKLFSSLITSTIWSEPHAVRIVWITMLAAADAKGFVEGSLPGMANAARVSLEEMIEAEAKLMSPDPYSRTQDHEGRRIERCAGGWMVLNYGIYREKLQTKEGSRAPSQKKYREELRKRGEHE